MTDKHLNWLANNPKCDLSLKELKYLQALEHYGFSPVICLYNWSKKELRELRSKYEKAIKPS